MIKKMTIEGMNCKHCEESVKNVFSEFEQFTFVSVSAKTQLLCFEAPSESDFSELKERIEDLGFDVIGIE